MSGLQSIVVFVIALDDSSRAGALTHALASLGLSSRRISAVDGRRMAPEQLRAHAFPQAGRTLYGAELTPTQVGCVLSHRVVYAEFVESGAPWALILEDDAYPSVDLQDVLRWVPDHEWPRPTVVELFSAGRINLSATSMLSEGGLLFQKLKTFPGFTVAYLINRAAAQRALAHHGRVASRADWPAWAADIDFWRVVPNVVAHGSPGPAATSTMLPLGDVESLWAKAVRWIGLVTGVSYLRLRHHYPGGVRQYYRHAVKPPVLNWLGRFGNPAS